MALSVTEKANKVDVEMCMRWVDLLHKMVAKIMHLMTSKARAELDISSPETQNARQSKRVQLLNQF